MLHIVGEDDLVRNEEDEGNDENSDNSNKELGEESAFQKKIEKKKNQLNREEARLNQMR